MERSREEGLDVGRQTPGLIVVALLQCIGGFGVAVASGEVVAQVGSAIALAAAIAMALFRRRRAGYIVALWFAYVALAEGVASHEPLAWIGVISESARWAVPLAIIHPRLLAPILRIGASATFAGHGAMAIALKPIFLAYLQHSLALIGIDLGYESASLGLRIIGGIDVVLAVTLWLPISARFSVAYMSVWGVLTALVRTVYGGIPGIVQTLIRVANGGAPIMLWLHWRDDAATNSSP